MALLLRKIVKGYFYLNEEASDERTNVWLLMSNPFPTFGIIAFYLYFVFKLGPRIMEKRTPYKLDRTLVVYNLIQILSSGYIVYRNVALAWRKYSLICQPIDFSYDPEAIEFASLIYYYYLLKVVDLLDTVFFIMRKKNNQVSFLHVYHHAGMVMLGWAATKFLAGGHSIYVSTLNSFVHIVMYTYYLLTAWDAEYKKSVWWKKHITQLQMIQFMIIIILYSQLLFQSDCAYPSWTALIFVPQNLFMFILFGDFYIKAYWKRPAKNSSDKLNGDSGKIKSS